jgi:hypothetical protein
MTEKHERTSWAIDEVSSPELIAICQEAYKKERAWKSSTELQFMTTLIVLGLITYEKEIVPKDVEVTRAVVGENSASRPGTTYGKILCFPRRM